MAMVKKMGFMKKNYMYRLESAWWMILLALAGDRVTTEYYIFQTGRALICAIEFR